MKKTWISAVGLATLAASAAAAQDGVYIKGGVGYGGMEEATVARPGGSGEIDPEGDARFMLGVGRAFSNGWRVDADIMDRYADGGAVNDNTPTTTDIQNVTLMLNAIRDFNREGKVSPYLGLGVGASRSDVAIAGNFLGPIDAEADSTEFAFQGLAGLGVQLSDRLKADFEYRYVDLGDVDGAGFSFEDMVSHDVLFGLRYALNAPAAPAPARAAPPAPPTAPVQAPAAPACDNVDFIVYFEWDRSDLTDQAVRTISTAADQASQCSITRVSIEGHADRSGSAQYNVGLSERRARVVRDELIRRGVAASAITVQALGESDPAVDTPDGVREPLNRRSEVLIVVAGSSS